MKTIFLSQLFGIVSGIRGIHEICVNTPVGLIYIHEPVVDPYFPFLKGYFADSVPKKFLLELASAFWGKTKEDMRDGYESYFNNRHFMDVMSVVGLFDALKEILAESLIPYSNERLEEELQNFCRKVVDLKEKPQKRGIYRFLGLQM